MNGGKNQDDFSKKRNRVVRSYHSANALAGFMDDGHFRAFAEESLQMLDAQEADALLRQVESARAHVARLAPVDLSGVELQSLAGHHIDSLEGNETFKALFGKMSHRFAWINPRKLVAVQVYCRLIEESIPTEENELIECALPREWNVPAEISFTPPTGPFFVTSSSPMMQGGLQVATDVQLGQVIIKPPLHVNLIQAVQYGGKYFLRNGSHRVVGAIAAGLEMIPALVYDATGPQDVELGPLIGFGAGYSMGLPRPPLVADFGTAAGVDIQMREKRYGYSLTLQISPINIGV